MTDRSDTVVVSSSPHPSGGGLSYSLPPCGGGLGWGGCLHPPPQPSPTRGEGETPPALGLPRKGGGRRKWLCLLALLALAPPARATSYGEVDVIVASDPKGDSKHGYFEYVILVTNHSRERAHTVGL